MTRPHPGLVELAAGRAVPPVTDWEPLLRSAREHRMTGLLWSRVRTGGLSCPEPWKSDLAGGDVVTRARHRRMWHTLSHLAHLLGELGVEFAVLKGVPVEARWYEREGERPCRDIDLLIAPACVGRLPEVVAVLQPGHRMDGAVGEMMDRGLGQSIDLVVDGIGVDVHLDLFKLGPPAPRPDQLWQRTVPFLLPGGTTVRVLDAELSLVHLLLHLNRDSFCWLLGFADIARILEREPIDWDAVGGVAEEQGLDATVWCGLRAVTETLGLPALTKAPPPGWRARVWGVLWRPAVRLQGDLGWVRYRRRPYWLPVVAQAGWGPTLRWARGQLTLSPGLVASANPGLRGPSWWRLLRGRWGRVVDRRRALARLRRVG